jgi:hypothetical protein
MSPEPVCCLQTFADLLRLMTLGCGFLMTLEGVWFMTRWLLRKTP